MKKGFCLDLHISVISDVKNIISQVYGNQIEITHWCISDHHSIIGMERANVEIVNHMTWRQITKEMIEDFQKKYWNFLSTFDFFIVTHSPVFALLYAPFGKPILCINSCRYEQPFSFSENFEMWRYLNSELYYLSQQGILTIISNSKADRDHLKIGTGIESIHIPSLCLYTVAKYNPVYKVLICFDSSQIIPTTNFTWNKNILIPGYKWEDLYKFIGIIHIPYEISTMSIFEQYSACIPLLFPTKRFLKKLIQSGRIEFQGPYNKKNYIPEVKETYGENWIDFWLDRADYYDQENMPYITYFDSIPDLLEIIPTINFMEIHEKMKIHNQNRIQKSMFLFACTFNNALMNNKLEYLQDFRISEEEIITTDKYMDICNNNGIMYRKTDYIFVPGVYRNIQYTPTYPSSLQKICTGHSDFEIRKELVDTFRNKFPLFYKWYGINMDFIDIHTQGLPLGVTNNCDDSPVHRIYGDNSMILSLLEKKKEIKYLCYMNIKIDTYPEERQKVYDLFSEKEWVENDKESIPREKFLEKIYSSKFVICPRGNGIDTHRLWETLYLQSIPIVKNCNAMSWFKELPILFVNDWSEVTEEYLEIKYKEFMGKKWPLDMLTISYWKNIICL